MPEERSGLLKGRTAVVTGAQRGIGFAFAKRWAAEGAEHLFCADLEMGPNLRELQERHPGVVQFLQYDQGDPKSIQSMFAEVALRGNGLYALAHSAIFSERARLLNADPLGIKKTIDVSLVGGILVLQAAAQLMVAAEQGGHMVLVGSPHAEPFFAVPTCLAYNAAKAGMLSAMKTLAVELLQYHITVNEVVPGWTDTPGERKFQTEEAIQAAVKQMPAGQLINPDEIADVGTLFLDRRFVTGQRWGITGGVDLPFWSQRDQKGGV